MARYRIYGILTASKVCGEVDAESEEAAIDKAATDPAMDTYVSLCYQCANEVDLGDVYKFEAELIDD